MGKRARQQHLKIWSKIIFLTLFVAVFYQNCSDIRLVGALRNSSISPDSPSADSVMYTTTTSDQPIDGGTEPHDWNVNGSYWFYDFTYGDPGFKSCSVFNMAKQQQETLGLTVITGKVVDVVDKTGKTPVVKKVTIPFELVASKLTDMRFGGLGQDGIIAFRIFVPPTLDKFSTTLTLGIGGVINALPEGMVLSLSKNLCDFRETNLSQKIFTNDYCTIGNTGGGGLDINTAFTVAGTSSTSSCNVEAGYYYYLNIIAGHHDFNPDQTSVLNGALYIRGQ